MCVCEHAHMLMRVLVLFMRICVWVCIWLCVYSGTCSQVREKALRACSWSWSYRELWTSYSECWEPHFGPLQKPSMLLTLTHLSSPCSGTLWWVSPHLALKTAIWDSSTELQNRVNHNFVGRPHATCIEDSWRLAVWLEIRNFGGFLECCRSWTENLSDYLQYLLLTFIINLCIGPNVV